MKAAIICSIALFGSFGHAEAQPLVEGRVRLSSGQPAAGAQVRLFDLSDLRRSLATTTDETGYFALSSGALRVPAAGDLHLGPNYPNPFNPSTVIPFHLPASTPVRLEVFNLLGQRIATLVDGELTAGYHTVPWNGTDAAGRPVAAGVYLYRLSFPGGAETGSMVLTDGRAGAPGAGGGAPAAGPVQTSGTAPVYGLTVAGPGLETFVDPAFRVEAGMAPVDLVVEALGGRPRPKAAAASGLLGDVDNSGLVDIVDALLLAMYSANPSIVMPNGGDISLGDVNQDGTTDFTDAWLIARYSLDPSDPLLPPGIGEPLAPPAALSPDPSTVEFGNDGAWHAFTVQAGEPVAVVANPGEGAPLMEISARSTRFSFCPAEAGDAVSTEDGSSIYLSGCEAGTGTVELRRAEDQSVLRTYTIEIEDTGGSPPDLVVDLPAVSDSSLNTGQSFTLSVTVRNQGEKDSEATTLRYYRSTNRTISSWDTEAGTGAVDALSAAGTGTLSISLTAPASPGTWYYGACVESVSGEGNTRNNCSRGVKVTVGSADLIVESPAASDASPDAGAAFTLSATVRNRGDSGSTLTVLRYYRSDDATISTSDTQVGTDAVSSLSGNATSPESVRLTAPANPGTWYYGACVRPVPGESDTGNNCSAAVEVTVSSSDLVVESPAVSDGSPETGASFTLSATVRNQGSSQSASTVLRYYRSQDAAISTSDAQVGTKAVGALPAAGISTESISLRAPASPATWYYGACVSPVSGESDTGNNCSSAVEVTVTAPEPRLSKMYWTDWGTDRIRRADLDGSQVEELVAGAGLEGPDGLAIDADGGRMYWTDAGTARIQRAALDGSQVQDLVTSGLTIPAGIALDTDAGKMYWADAGTGKIQRSNLDGSAVEDLVTRDDGLAFPTGLALDPARGRIYWTDPGTDKIQGAGLDGSQVQDLVSSGLDNPSALALDPEGGRMYWTDRGTRKIQRANLDGSGVEDLIGSGLDLPGGLALDLRGGKMYWTDRGTGKIQRANLDGSGVEDLLTTADGLENPSGLALAPEAGN